MPLSDSDVSHQDVIVVEGNIAEKTAEEEVKQSYESKEHTVYIGPSKGPESPDKEVFMSSSHPHVSMTSPLSGIQIEASRFYGGQQERGLSTATMTSGVLSLSHSSTMIMASHEGVIYGSPISISRQNSAQPGSLIRHSSRGTPRSPLRKIDDYFPVKPWSREKQVGIIMRKEEKNQSDWEQSLSSR